MLTRTGHARTRTRSRTRLARTRTWLTRTRINITAKPWLFLYANTITQLTQLTENMHMSQTQCKLHWKNYTALLTRIISMCWRQFTIPNNLPPKQNQLDRQCSPCWRTCSSHSLTIWLCWAVSYKHWGTSRCVAAPQPAVYANSVTDAVTF